MRVAIDASCCNVVNGLQRKKIDKYIFITSITFTIFQAVMFLLGYNFTHLFGNQLYQISNLLAFMLLLYLGIVSIISSFKKEEVNQVTIKNILIHAIATSIDASALGVACMVLKMNIITSLILIMAFTFTLSFLSFILGIIIGDKVNKHAKLISGIVFILLALKVLLI